MLKIYNLTSAHNKLNVIKEYESSFHLKHVSFSIYKHVEGFEFEMNIFVVQTKVTSTNQENIHA